MKLKRLVPLLMMVMSFMFIANVKAETVYEEWDVERVYIECDTAINSLTKAEYSDAKISVVLKDGTVQIEDTEGKVKLRGNSTSKAEKKPVNIKFSSKQSVLGMDEGKKWCILANAFDKTLLRNSLCFDLGNKMGLSYISQSKFIDLFYNGELMGSYLITEPVDPGANLVDIEEEGDDFMIEIERERYEEEITYVNTKNGIRFAINVPETPTKDQVTNIENYLKNVETALKTYKMSEYEKYIDVDSFVNYYIVCEIFKAVDFNYSSTRFYVKDNKMYAGPLWDVDLSSGNASSEFYKDYYNGGVSYKDLFCTEMKWYGYLIKSDEFVLKVNARLKEMLPIIENMYKTNAKGTNQIDSLLNTYGNSFNRNYASVETGGAGWSITKRYSTADNPKGLEYLEHLTTYSANVEMLRAWLQNRVNYLQSEWSAIVNNKVDMLTAEKKSYSKIYLSWYNQGVADGNEIYYKVKGGEYKLLTTINDGYKQEYTVKNLKPGIKYYFKVRSFVNSSKGKQYSEFATISKKMKLTSPKVKVKRVSSKKTKITWKKVKGADGYIVYTATQKGKYKMTKVIKGNKKLTYLKKNCKKGKKYYFKVKAYVEYNGKRYLSK